MVRIQEQVGHKRLVVELPGVKDIEEAIEAIGKTPYLEFKKERSEEETNEILARYEEEGGDFPEDPYFKSTQGVRLKNDYY